MQTATEISLTTELLRTLAQRVRFLTAEQAARGWFATADDPAAAAAVLAELHSRELVERAVIEVRTAGTIAKPLFRWRPGQKTPAPETWFRLEELLATRWSEEMVATEVFIAAPRAANLLGVRPPGLGRPCEWSHDLRITEVYLHYRQTRPELARRWRGEGARPKWGHRIGRMKDPDAMLLDGRGAIAEVIEIAGKYSAAHLADLHDHCAGDAYERFESWRSASGVDFAQNPYERIEIGYELW